MLGYITLLYSLPDFILSTGLSRNRATQISAILNVGTAVGRPWIGVASDHFGRFEVASGLRLLCGLCCFAIWIPATSFGVTVLFASVAGEILGVFWLTIGPLCVEVAGLQHLFDDLAMTGRISTHRYSVGFVMSLPVYSSGVRGSRSNRGTSHLELRDEIGAFSVDSKDDLAICITAPTVAQFDKQRE